VYKDSNFQCFGLIIQRIASFHSIILKDHIPSSLPSEIATNKYNRAQPLLYAIKRIRSMTVVYKIIFTFSLFIFYFSTPKRTNMFLRQSFFVPMS